MRWIAGSCVIGAVVVCVCQLACAQSATTDPVSLLRQTRRIQFLPDGRVVEPGDAGEVSQPGPTQPPKSPDIEQNGLASEQEPGAEQQYSSPNVDGRDTVSKKVRNTPRAASGGILGRLPLVGRLVRSREGSSEEQQHEPTATPPVLLPPPSSDAEPIQPTPPPASSAKPEFYQSQQSDPRITPASRASSGGVIIGPSSPDSRLTQPGSPVSAATVPSGTPRPLRQAAPATPENNGSLSAQTQAGDRTTLPVSSSPQQRANASPSPHIIYPRLTNADFVAPPPEVEPNDAARNEYLSALAAAREGKRTEAARAFRSFAQRYPSSRLASRALFLAALVESDPAAVSETVALLQRFFPRSEYLTELALRGVISSPESPPATPTPTVSLDAATSSSAADQRLEMLREISRVRTEAEAAYRDKNYAEAIGTIENCAYAQCSPDLLDLLARCYIAQGDSRRAAEIIHNVLEKFPSYEGRSNLRLSYGLLLEDAGKYERAVAEYRLLIEEAPDSVEAQTARTRIQQLNQLTR